MAFLKTLKNPPAIIITTAYHQYAVEGFELNVTDYLLKPFEFERFFIAVNKVKTGSSSMSHDSLSSQISGQRELSADSSGSKDHLFLNVQKKKVKLSFSDIVYIESQREYIKIVTTKHEYISKMSTHEIESLLPAQLFKRIHRSYIISVSKIDSYTAEIVEVNGISIPIGRGYKDVLDNL
jgi:DNA-binding LytR/AlgR family response regulator